MQLESLLEMFRNFLPGDHASSYTSQKFQKRLEKEYKDEICILPQRGQGRSSLVMRSDISLKDAITQASVLKHKVYISTCEQTDNEILHAAASVLRSSIKKIPENRAVYPSPDEIENALTGSYIPDDLCLFLSWLLDEKSYSTMSSLKPDNHKMRKCISIAEAIMVNNVKISSPLQTGLAVQFHNEFGSRQAIDILSSHGFCISYDELRRFLSSAAFLEGQKVVNGVYAPSGLIKKDEGGEMVWEGSDNVDINTLTIDGKNTYHSMARVKFQYQALNRQNINSLQIERLEPRSLPLTPPQLRALTEVDNVIIPKLRPVPAINQGPDKSGHSTNISINCGEVPSISHKSLTWIILRTACRNKLTTLNLFGEGQAVPFWSGHFHSTKSSKW